MTENANPRLARRRAFKAGILRLAEQLRMQTNDASHLYRLHITFAHIALLPSLPDRRRDPTSVHPVGGARGVQRNTSVPRRPSESASMDVRIKRLTFTRATCGESPDKRCKLQSGNAVHMLSYSAVPCR